MRRDLAPGNPFPDLRLPDHTGQELTLAEIARAQPLVLCFVRGWWCPKEQVRVRNLVSMQEELQREYGKIAVVTVDEPYVNGAFRAGLGAAFPFLSDAKHRPFLPFTFVLDSRLRIHRFWCGFWFWGNPTPDELRLALREVTRAEQPTYEPQAVWSAGGFAPPDAGIDAEVIWIREDREGREIQRGVHTGQVPEIGSELSRSSVDGRPWLVHDVERVDGRVAVHLRKGGEPDTSREVRHHMTAPR